MTFEIMVIYNATTLYYLISIFLDQLLLYFYVIILCVCSTRLLYTYTLKHSRILYEIQERYIITNHVFITKSVSSPGIDGNTIDVLCVFDIMHYGLIKDAYLPVIAMILDLK